MRSAVHSEQSRRIQHGHRLLDSLSHCVTSSKTPQHHTGASLLKVAARFSSNSTSHMSTGAPMVTASSLSQALLYPASIINITSSLSAALPGVATAQDKSENSPPPQHSLNKLH